MSTDAIGLGSDLAKLEGDEIVIRVPLAAIPHAAKIAFEEANYSVDESTGETSMVVTNARTFALDMIRELNAESEDGSTPIHYLLDRAVIDASEGGSEGVDDATLSTKAGE